MAFLPLLGGVVGHLVTSPWVIGKTHLIAKILAFHFLKWIL